MSDFWPAAALGTTRLLLAGGVALLLAYLAARRIGDPARRRRVLAWSVRAAVLTCGLTLLPAWLSVPVPGWRKAPEPVPESVALREAAEVPSEAEPEEFAWILTDPPPVELSEAVFDPPTVAVLTTPMPATPPAAGRTQPPEDPLAAVAAILLVPYWMGVAAVLLRQLVGHVGLARLRRAARPANHDVQALATELAGGTAPRILVSDRVGAPVCFGVFRPTVLLPRVLPQLASPDQLRWVLAHELDHLRRGDPRTGVWVGLAAAVYFVLPWFWGVRRDLNLAQEYLADAAAAGSRATDYAAFLVDLSSRPGVPRSVRAVPSLAGVRAGQSDLYRRVTMLLQPKTSRKSRWGRAWSAVALCSAVTAAVAISGVNLTADEPRKADEGRKVERRDGDRKPEEGKRDGDRPRDGDRKPAEVREIEVKLADATEVAAQLEKDIAEAAKAGNVETVKKLAAKLREVAALERGPRVEKRAPAADAVRVRVEAALDEETVKLEKAIEKLKQAAEEVKDQPEAKAALEKSIAEYRKKIAEARKSGELRPTDVKPRAVEGVRMWQGQGVGNPQALEQLKGSMDQMMKAYEKQLAELTTDPTATKVLKESMKAYQSSMDQLAKQLAGGMPGQFEFKAMPPMTFKLGENFAGNALTRKVPASGRLGVMIEPVPGVVAEQLDLPAGKGVVLLTIVPDSPAAKAGLKAHDILLEVAGKQITADDLAKVVTGLKVAEPFDVVVVRKGKKETVKGVTLPEPKEAVKKAVASSSSMSVSVNGDQFEITQKTGDRTFHLKGTLGDADAVAVTITDADTKQVQEYKGLKNVPATYEKQIEKLMKSVSK